MDDMDSMGGVTTGLLWAAILGSGVMAGVYFAFSSFVMPALARMDAPPAIGAMQSINTTILRTSFMPLFFGSTLLALALAVLGLWRWGDPGSVALVLGGAVYVLGMFVLTAASNVPLNNALDAADAASAEGAALWRRYLVEWTRWNTVRTVASAVACAAFVWALLAGSAGAAGAG